MLERKIIRRTSVSFTVHSCFLQRWEAPEEEEEEEEVMLHGAEFSLEEEDLDQEVMWLQKTQQLKGPMLPSSLIRLSPQASQISRRDEPQQKGKPNPWRPTRAPRPGEAHRPGHRLCPPPGGGGGGARPQARKELNLKNTPPVALPPISSSGASWGLHGVSDWENETSLGYLDVPLTGDVHAPWRLLHGAGGRGLVALGYHQPKRGNPPQGFQNKIASRGQRAQAPQWLLSYDEEHILIHNVDKDIFPQDSPRWAGEVQLRRSGSHLVLPPIGDGGRPVGGGGGGEPQLSPGPVSPTVSPSTPGYLAHMERQKQLKERVAYKITGLKFLKQPSSQWLAMKGDEHDLRGLSNEVYTLKDYRQLKQVVNLCGLGPDKANEKTAEKMRRQRLYSNVIREQNKKTSTIPPLPPKDPEDIDKTVPRRKALEYAKRIAKPHPKPQPKKHQDQSEGFPGLLGSAHLEGLDLAQLKALDDMRRRHEEEKRAVASFRKESGSSPGPFSSSGFLSLISLSLEFSVDRGSESLECFRSSWAFLSCFLLSAVASSTRSGVDRYRWISKRFSRPDSCESENTVLPDVKKYWWCSGLWRAWCGCGARIGVGISGYPYSRMGMRDAREPLNGE
ncbi:Jhy [Merluccius polli]|uniref:Jhy n=1 Tax=Merluccius polli TaxID=89951 RepID=A0AA47NTI7_MERPO|nr:Jhy [Merluccius polli]